MRLHRPRHARRSRRRSRDVARDIGRGAARRARNILPALRRAARFPLAIARFARSAAAAVRAQVAWIALGVVALTAAFFGAGYGWDRSEAGRTAAGATVAGVEIGALERDVARRKLRRALRQRYREPIDVVAGSGAAGQTFRFTAREAALSVDVGATVDRAFRENDGAGFLSRTLRRLGVSSASVSPEVKFDRAALDRWVAGTAARVDRPPRNASLAFTGRRLKVARARPGRTLDRDRLAADLERRLRQPGLTGPVAAALTVKEPSVRRGDVATKNPVVITVNRNTFRATLWRKLKRVKTYTIAVGAAGFDSPGGTYHIINKAVNPVWSVPKSGWAGDQAGEVIPPGPGNPLKARWMAVTYDGVGFHGTDDTWSLGTRASHGCFRMAVPDIIELYDMTPVGTPVIIL